MKREALIRKILIKELEYAPSVALRAASTMKNALLKTKNANSDTYPKATAPLNPIVTQFPAPAPLLLPKIYSCQMLRKQAKSLTWIAHPLSKKNKNKEPKEQKSKSPIVFIALSRGKMKEP